MPALIVSVADMVGALERAAGPEVSALIGWVPDPVVAGMVAGGYLLPAGAPIAGLSTTSAEG